MNQFYNAIEVLKQRLEANTNVNTVVFGQIAKDVYKKNVYPLCHINAVDAQLGSNAASLFTFEIAALDQRDISKSIATDKFDGNDNIIDNLNITFTILNDLISYLQHQNNDLGIELVSVNNANPILFKEYNTLDGWICNITISVPSNQDAC